MHREDPISPSHQMYLKALYRLSLSRPVGRVRDLAAALGITPGTVSTGLARLQQLGLVDRERYGGVELTAAGVAIARCVTRRYDTLKQLLIEVFGLDPEQAESDACRMEHAVSPITINRMASLLTRLEAGESFDLHSLSAARRGANASSDSACADCEAAGVCTAVASVTAERGGSR